MDILQFRDFCMSFPGVTEEFPFDNKTLVFKVMGKMFALTDVDDFESINLKCDPERSIILREEYAEINPGYHMNKKHWNTIDNGGRVDDKLLKELITHSYDLVVGKLSKKNREKLRTQK